MREKVKFEKWELVERYDPLLIFLCLSANMRPAMADGRSMHAITAILVVDGGEA